MLFRLSPESPQDLDPGSNDLVSPVRWSFDADHEPRLRTGCTGFPIPLAQGEAEAAELVQQELQGRL